MGGPAPTPPSVHSDAHMSSSTHSHTRILPSASPPIHTHTQGCSDVMEFYPLWTITRLGSTSSAETVLKELRGATRVHRDTGGCPAWLDSVLGKRLTIRAESRTSYWKRRPRALQHNQATLAPPCTFHDDSDDIYTRGPGSRYCLKGEGRAVPPPLPPPPPPPPPPRDSCR